jgi:hypothetical protein
LQPGRIFQLIDGDIDRAVGPLDDRPGRELDAGRVAGEQRGDLIPIRQQARTTRLRLMICSTVVVAWTSVKDSRSAVISSLSFTMGPPAA